MVVGFAMAIVSKGGLAPYLKRDCRVTTARNPKKLSIHHRDPNSDAYLPTLLNEKDLSSTLENVTRLVVREQVLFEKLHWIKFRLPTMKFAVAASLIASAAAFAPAKQAAKTSALSAFEDALGAQAPLGFFDPLGLVADGDQAKFDRLRYVELKHGRISMLAVVGYLVQEAGVRLPGPIDFSGKEFADIPNGFAALKEISGAGVCQILVFIGLLESSFMRDVTGLGEFPGDFRNGFIDFGWDSFDEETKLNKRAIELNQGRAAQMGILALMVHEQLGDQLLPGSS
jgi:Chlorophyll A-B binding protein